MALLLIHISIQQERACAMANQSNSQKPQDIPPFVAEEPLETTFEHAPAPLVNRIYPHVMLACVLGVLFAVAVTAPMRPGTQPAAPETHVAQVSPQVHDTAVTPPAQAAVAAVAAAPQARDLAPKDLAPKSDSVQVAKADPTQPVKIAQAPAAQQVAEKTSTAPVHPVSHPVQPVHHATLTAAVKLPTSPVVPESTSLAPVAPAAETVHAELASPPALVDAPGAFRYLVEGDDEIVDVNAAQRSIETSLGKTFYVDGTFGAVIAEGDTQTNLHYRCDQSASCTISLADATVLHATMRNHHGAAAPTELSMTVTQDTMPGFTALDGMNP
jgi:hypothetical protein